jgi:hypothetical protein
MGVASLKRWDRTATATDAGRALRLRQPHGRERQRNSKPHHQYLSSAATQLTPCLGVN